MNVDKGLKIFNKDYFFFINIKYFFGANIFLFTINKQKIIIRMIKRCSRSGRSKTRKHDNKHRNKGHESHSFRSFSSGGGRCQGRTSHGEQCKLQCKGEYCSKHQHQHQLKVATVERSKRGRDEVEDEVEEEEGERHNVVVERKRGRDEVKKRGRDVKEEGAERHNVVVERKRGRDEVKKRGRDVAVERKRGRDEAEDFPEVGRVGKQPIDLPVVCDPGEYTKLLWTHRTPIATGIQFILGAYKNIRGCQDAADSNSQVICGVGAQFRYGLDLNYGEVVLIMKDDFWQGMRGFVPTSKNFANFPILYIIGGQTEIEAPWVLDVNNLPEYNLARTRMQADALRFRKESIERFLEPKGDDWETDYDYENHKVPEQLKLIESSPCNAMNANNQETRP